MSGNTFLIGFQNNALWLKEIDTESLFKPPIHWGTATEALPLQIYFLYTINGETFFLK